MCDDFTQKDMEAGLRVKGLNRRDFNRLTSAAVVAMILPSVANALDVQGAEVLIETPDGVADCYFVSPTSGTHPGVILWPDIMGLRPSNQAMADRLAQSGYSVLVPNPYYRKIAGRVTPEGMHISDPEIRAKITPLREGMNPISSGSDSIAFVAWLDKQGSVDSSRKMGVIGYCMSGSYALRAAAVLPERIGAAASFHGGGLASDSENSPHLWASMIEAGLLIAIAENDDAQEPDAKFMLRDAFDKAGVEAEIEVYEGALHGWCPPDSPVYNEVQAERAWSRLLTLFSQRLVQFG